MENTNEKMPDKPVEKQTDHGHRSGKVLAGLVIVCIGGVLLFRQMGFYFPGWIFSWPMILIAVGLYSGAHHSFRSNGWLILTGIGGIFLIGEIMPWLSLGRYIFPALIIFAGLMIAFSSNRKKRWHDRWNHDEWKDKWKEELKDEWKDKWKDGRYAGMSGATGENSYDDYIDQVSVFGGVNKIVVSKTFKGGDVVNIFGGTDLNLTQADIQGNVILDVTQIFGGCKIIVPRNWKVISEMTAIFGGMEDKRYVMENEYDVTKVLIIRGVTIFGGIEVQSY